MADDGIKALGIIPFYQFRIISHRHKQKNNHDQNGNANKPDFYFSPVPGNYHQQ
jgi:hypothetical protein